MKNAPAPIAVTPAASPSRPSMKLTALIVSTVSRIVIGMAEIAAEVDDAGVAPELRQQGQLHAALGDHDAGRHDLAGQLGERVQLVAVIEDADRTDDRAAISTQRSRARR